MKFSIAQLNKYTSTPLMIDDTIDLSDMLKEEMDIIRMEPISVQGEAKNIGFEDYIFSLNLQTTLILPCANTLEEVPFEIDIDLDEVFREDGDNEEFRPIEKGTIDLDPVIFEHILLEKPMRVVKKELELEQQPIEDHEDNQEESKNPFASLQGYFDNK